MASNSRQVGSCRLGVFELFIFFTPGSKQNGRRQVACEPALPFAVNPLLAKSPFARARKKIPEKPEAHRETHSHILFCLPSPNNTFFWARTFLHSRETSFPPTHSPKDRRLQRQLRRLILRLAAFPRLPRPRGPGSQQQAYRFGSLGGKGAGRIRRGTPSNQINRQPLHDALRPRFCEKSSDPLSSAYEGALHNLLLMGFFALSLPATFNLADR